MVQAACAGCDSHEHAAVAAGTGHSAQECGALSGCRSSRAPAAAAAPGVDAADGIHGSQFSSHIVVLCAGARIPPMIMIWLLHNLVEQQHYSCEVLTSGVSASLLPRILMSLPCLHAARPLLPGRFCNAGRGGTAMPLLAGANAAPVHGWRPASRQRWGSGGSAAA